MIVVFEALSSAFKRSRFLTGTRGSVSVELVIALPLLLWALAATAVFYDGFRTRYATQGAAYAVADALSRQTDAFTDDYMEGMNNIFDYLAATATDTRMRISSVSYNPTNAEFELEWSYGTRSLPALPDNIFTLLASGDSATLEGAFGDGTGLGFDYSGAQMPIEDLASRIPTILPGESILLVETFALWTPFASVGLGQMRLNTVVPIRSRYTSQQVLDGQGDAGGSSPLDTIVEPDPLLDPPDVILDTNVNDPTLTTSVIYRQSFEDLIWLGGTWGELSRGILGPYGGFLGPFGGETWNTPIQTDVNLGDFTDVVSIEFDLLIFDTWDGYDVDYARPEGDTIALTIDGAPFFVDAFAQGPHHQYANDRYSSVYLNGAWITTHMTVTESGRNFGNAIDNDHVWHVTIQARNLPQSFNFGIRMASDELILNEAFGLDNFFVVGGRGGPGWTIPVKADSTSAYATDPYNLMPLFEGCPDPRMPAQWHTLNLSQIGLVQGFNISRIAGGPTPLNTCPSLPDVGYAMASPNLVLNYNNENSSGPGNRLMVAAYDGNKGEICDSTLLIRDPNGQWYFNDDWDNLDPAVHLGDAPTGIYHIFIGNVDQGYCYPRLRFERY